jgi:hypothetical protein
VMRTVAFLLFWAQNFGIRLTSDIKAMSKRLSKLFLHIFYIDIPRMDHY